MRPWVGDRLRSLGAHAREGRAEDQPEQSYSERQIYEAAIGRLARELAAMENIDEPAAQLKIEQVLKAA